MLKVHSLNNIKRKVEIKQIDSTDLMNGIISKFDLEVEDSGEWERYIGKYISENLFNTIARTLGYISTDIYYFYGELETNDENYRFSNSVQIYWNVHLKEYSRVISVSLEDFGMDQDVCYANVLPNGLIEGIDEQNLNLINSIPGDYSFDLHLSRLNNLNGDAYFEGTFHGEGNRILEVSNIGVIYQIKVVGVKNDTITPSWLEYLIDGLLDLENENKKMALFNLFAALDNLINTEHEYIYEEYLELCKKIKITEPLKEKIRLFSPKEKRLENKLSHILTEFKIRNGTSLECYKHYKKIVTIRDKVAHGGQFENGIDVKKTAYSIVALIYILLLQENIEETSWRGIRS